jgi:hypothetical protein
MAETKPKTWLEKFKQRLKDNKDSRGKQFSNYLSMIDSLESKKFVSRRGRVANPGTDLNFQAGKVRSASTTKMSTVLDKYHSKALRLAQAKYYAKQVG